MGIRLTARDRENRDKIDRGFNVVIRVLLWSNLIIIPLVFLSWLYS